MKKGIYKNCLSCNKKYYVYPYISGSSKFCSLNCYWINKKQDEKTLKKLALAREKLKGKPAWNKGRKTGVTPWNKGKSIRLSPKSEFKKGMTPWNKKPNIVCLCQGCGKEFTKKNGTSGKFCQYKCYWDSLTGKPAKNMEGLKLGRLMKGEKHGNWKGGVSPKNKIIRRSLQFKQWREKVFERDNYICQLCDAKGVEIHPNHIKKFSDYPNLRFDVSNGITLCKNCHFKIVTNHEEEWESYFNFNLATRGFIEDKFLLVSTKGGDVLLQQ